MRTGILYAVSAGLLWGTSPVLVKRGLVHADVSAATLLQQASILVTLIAAAFAQGALSGESIASLAILVFVVTGFVGAYVGRTLFVKSVDQIGASRAQSINNASPLVTVFLAALFLGEPLTISVVSGVILIISGIFFAAEPEGKTNAPPPTGGVILAPVIATLCYGVVPVLKKIGIDHGESAVLGALVMHATGLVFLLVWGSLLKIEVKWLKIPTASVFCFIGAGVLYACGSILTLKALGCAPASVVAPIWSAQPIVSFILAKTVLRGIEEVNFKDGIAAVLVVAGVLVLRMG